MAQTTINGGKALARPPQGCPPSVGALSMRYSARGRITVNWHSIHGSVARRGGTPSPQHMVVEDTANAIAPRVAAANPAMALPALALLLLPFWGAA